MNNIYILYKLEPRAETTDTILYYASFNKGLLEEIILSLWEEMREFTDNIEIIKANIEKFHIINIPFIT